MDERLQFVARRLANRWRNLGGSLGALARPATRLSIAARNAEPKGWRTTAVGVRPAFLYLNLFDKF
jgi:hypothetical protein